MNLSFKARLVIKSCAAIIIKEDKKSIIMIDGPNVHLHAELSHW